MAFAALGAAEVVTVVPSHRRALALLDDAAAIIGSAGADRDWPWPESRLTYANAVLPDAMMAIGASRHRPDLVEAEDPFHNVGRTALVSSGELAAGHEEVGHDS